MKSLGPDSVFMVSGNLSSSHQESCIDPIELHSFHDALEIAYAAVCMMGPDGKIQVLLVTSIAPSCD